MNTYILSLSDTQADLGTVGGKGMSLARLSRAGIPVPGGFHITTGAYRVFVDANGLQAFILSALREVDIAQPRILEAASAEIINRFIQSEIPAELVKAIGEAYASLRGGNIAVAVRSSATAEDLPDASFAGQQESYLNIIGNQAVLEAVRKCWSSLWTARAIAYRARQGIDSRDVALAVVVQELAFADAAGVMFTANPVTGKRNEVMITAAWGLGESIVSGAVTPDTMLVDKVTGALIEQKIMEKKVMTIRAQAGTEERLVPASRAKKAVLNKAHVAELAGYAKKIEELYGIPMDIEWALVGRKFTFVQARPITALPEAPLEWARPHPKGIYMRTSIVDLMPEPLSPLFATLGIPALVDQMYPLGKYLTRKQPVLPEGYFTIINSYGYMNANFSGKTWSWIIFGMLASYPRMLKMLVRYWRDEAHPQYQQAVAETKAKAIEQMKPEEFWSEIQALVEASALYSDGLMFATMGANAGSEGLLTNLYQKLVQRDGDPPAATLLMGWDSLPMKAEKSLYDLNMFCRDHKELASYIQETPSATMVKQMVDNQTPPGIPEEDWRIFSTRFNAHLDQYGHMIFEMDFAKPLPRDYPEPMLEAIKMYLRGEGTNPYERQKASEERRLRLAEEAKGRLKGLKLWAFTKALNWAQSLSEVREDALAEIGLGYPTLRDMLHILGDKMVATGILNEAGDIFWLEKQDVDRAVTMLEGSLEFESMSSLVDERKAFNRKVKQVAPPPMIPMRKKYLGLNTSIWLAESEESQAGNALKGVPASPGKITATARVLHGPEDFDQMRPGEVLVASTTTPAWTPLFAMASAVVTDIGGPLSHGSIVAREYGIPAVMGTGIATRRIQSCQSITVDGSSGTVTLN